MLGVILIVLWILAKLYELHCKYGIYRTDFLP